MEKNNGKIIAIVALVVAVVALSVGFAAFNDALTIENTTANVTAANAFDDGTNGLAYDGTSPECHDTTTNDAINESPYGAGSASGDSWSDINVPLSTEHPSVTCTATVQNKTAYAAKLTGLATTTGISCTSSGQNKTTNENNVCGATRVTASIESDSITFGTAAGSLTGTASTVIAAKTTNPGEATVTVVIELQNPATVYADEDVTVTIPTITHSYTSAQ